MATVKSNLIAVEEIRRQIQPEAITTYAQAVTAPARRPVQMQRRSVPVPSFKAVRCFNCNREGHISRNCPDRLPNVTGQVFRRSEHKDSPRCFACKEIGHIRRDCPNVKCPICKRNGHFRHQCMMRNREDFKFRKANVINEDVPSNDEVDDDENSEDLNENDPLYGDMVGAISLK